MTGIQLPARSRLTLAAFVSASAMLSGSLPAAAMAAGCVGRPGASALEQYCEAVPNASGGRENPGTGNGAGGGVSKSTSRKLADRGDAGAAIAALAGGAGSGGGGSSSSGGGATSAGGDTGSGGKSSAGSTQGSDSVTKSVDVSGPANPSGSPLRATKEAISSGPTTGPVLAWGIVSMSAVGAVSAVVLRRRGGSLRNETDAPNAG